MTLSLTFMKVALELLQSEKLLSSSEKSLKKIDRAAQNTYSFATDGNYRQLIINPYIDGLHCYMFVEAIYITDSGKIF